MSTRLHRTARRDSRLHARDALASLVWAEVTASGLRQVEVAALAGVTEKHLSQIMRGHVTGSLDVIAAVLAAVGRELVLSTRVRTVEERTEEET